MPKKSVCKYTLTSIKEDGAVLQKKNPSMGTNSFNGQIHSTKTCLSQIIHVINSTIAALGDKCKKFAVEEDKFVERVEHEKRGAFEGEAQLPLWRQRDSPPLYWLSGGTGRRRLAWRLRGAGEGRKDGGERENSRHKSLRVKEAKECEELASKA